MDALYQLSYRGTAIILSYLKTKRNSRLTSDSVIIINMKRDTSKKPFSIISYFAPLGSALIFTILSCLNLRTAMWFDESYSAYLVRGDFGQIWQMTALDVHPPFYYFCLKVWSLLFGNSDFALRSMSVFFGGLTIILAFFLLRRWFGEKAAAISTLALSIAPIFVRYSQEMRMYALVFAIIIGATLVLDIALKSKRKAAWCAYALLVCLGMWTHYFSALAWLAQLGYIIYYFRQHGRQNSIFWVYPLAVLLYLPWLPSFFSQVKSVQSGFWIPPVDLSTPLSFFSESLVQSNAADAQSWLALLVYALIGLSAYLLHRHTPKAARGKFGFLLAMTFVPPILLMLLSLPPLKPTYVTRYVVYSASLLWVLVGLAIYWTWRYGKKILAAAFAALVLISASIGLYSVTARQNNEDVRGLVAVLQAHEAAPILVHVDAMSYYDFFFYESAERPIYGIDVDFVWNSLEPIRQYSQNYLSDPDSYIVQQDRFWLVLSNDHTDDNYVFAGFRPSDSIITDHYTATAYQKL